MIITLPLRNDQPHYQITCQLDSTQYVFEFWWNYRGDTLEPNGPALGPGKWLFSVFDVSGSPIVQGQLLKVDFPLLTRFTDPRLPTGFLYAYDSSGKHLDPGVQQDAPFVSDLGPGARVQLIYFPLVDVLAGNVGA